MILEDALVSLKKRLDIDADITEFDSQLEEYLADGVSRLSPTVYAEGDPETVEISIDSYGSAEIDLADYEFDDVRSIELYDSNGFADHDDFKIHGTILYIRNIISGVTSARIFGLYEFTLETVPRYLHLPVYYFAMSEFYSELVGNKVKYNVYMQNGRAEVDNMQDLVDFYDQKGVDYLTDKAQPYGR